MIQSITFTDVLPNVFLGRTLCSDVWSKQVTFLRGKNYLIEAESGTGKSSMCAFMYGYRKDYQGSICMDNQDVREMTHAQFISLWRSEIAILFQDLQLFPSLTALENVCVKNQLTHFREQKWIKDMFDRLQIGDKLHAKTSLLSWGQQQRVAFIRMLCQPASFLFMDEPISHLDDANAAIMTQILQEETQQRGVGIITTSIGKHLPLQFDQIYHL